MAEQAAVVVLGEMRRGRLVGQPIPGPLKPGSHDDVLTTTAWAGGPELGEGGGGGAVAVGNGNGVEVGRGSGVDVGGGSGVTVASGA